MYELAAVRLVLQQYTLSYKRYAESQGTFRKIHVLQIWVSLSTSVSKHRFANKLKH